MSTISITYWQRLEARPRSNDLGPELAAEVRDPLWFLTRQWQLGEFLAQDAGSLAYLEYATTSSPAIGWQTGNQSHALSGTAPLERLTLQDPIEPDLTIRVELSTLFARQLALLITSTTSLARLLAAVKTKYPLAITTEDPFAPLDRATRGFLAVCSRRASDGYELLKLARLLEGGGQPTHGHRH